MKTLYYDTKIRETYLLQVLEAPLPAGSSLTVFNGTEKKVYTVGEAEYSSTVYETQASEHIAHVKLR